MMKRHLQVTPEVSSDSTKMELSKYLRFKRGNCVIFAKSVVVNVKELDSVILSLPTKDKSVRSVLSYP